MQSQPGTEGIASYSWGQPTAACRPNSPCTYFCKCFLETSQAHTLTYRPWPLPWQSRDITTGIPAQEAYNISICPLRKRLLIRPRGTDTMTTCRARQSGQTCGVRLYKTFSPIHLSLSSSEPLGCVCPQLKCAELGNSSIMIDN